MCDNQMFDDNKNGQEFTGSEKFYTFNIYDHINVKYNVCNHNDSYKNLTGTYSSQNNIKMNEKKNE